MAKKKRGMPSKTCVNPACGKTIHARSRVCPHCQTQQSGKSARKPAAKPAASTRRRKKSEPQLSSGSSDAVSFVRQVGGLDKAKSLLQTIEDIKNL